MNQPDKFDLIYRATPLEKIPWNREKPPEFLVELIAKRKISPGKSLELGCGAGSDAIGLAMMGFDVTGIDVSPAAIKIARDNLRAKANDIINCRFIADDAISYLGNLNETFDFVYDKGLLHMLSLNKKEQYLNLVSEKLNADGKYFSCCFTEEDLGPSTWSRRKGFGAYVHVSRADLLTTLFKQYFEIIETRSVARRPDKIASHFTYVFMRKK